MTEAKDTHCGGPASHGPTGGLPVRAVTRLVLCVRFGRGRKGDLLLPAPLRNFPPPPHPEPPMSTSLGPQAHKQEPQLSAYPVFLGA